MKIFTLGYQSLNTEIYVQTLINAGVGMVIDVREHAWSQRPAFVKSRLRESLHNAGIDYSHVKSAGNPAANRKSARSAAECMHRYKQYLSANFECLYRLIEMLRAASESGRPTCLTCYERIHTECHRSILVEELRVIEPSIAAIILSHIFQSQATLGLRRDLTR